MNKCKAFEADAQASKKVMAPRVRVIQPTANPVTACVVMQPLECLDDVADEGPFMAVVRAMSLVAGKIAGGAALRRSRTEILGFRGTIHRPLH